MGVVFLTIFTISSALAADGPELLVGAAADLQPLQPELSESFAKAGGCRLRFSFGASGVLARQIRNGAPYDVYLSANEEYVRQLLAAGRLASGSVRLYAFGRLALWSRNSRVGGLEDLRQPDVRHVAIANPSHAPYGLAASELLERQGLWREIEPKLVYGENVQQAFQFAKSGNADAAITAWSIVIDKGGVPLPAGSHPPIRQSGGIVEGSPNSVCARAFLNFLTVGEGRRILQSHGLDPVSRTARK